MPDRLRIDHVILPVHDLEAAALIALEGHGLATVPGGRHPGHGTGNRIIPLGDSYLELMAVLDPDEAATSPMGRWVTAHQTSRLAPAALCLRTDHLEGHASRLGLAPRSMTRERPDGTVLSWSLAGLEETFGPDRLPFFIQWHVDPADHPGRMEAPHRVSPRGITGIELGGDPSKIEQRLGAHHLPIVVSEGEPGMRRVVIATDEGEVVLP